MRELFSEYGLFAIGVIVGTLMMYIFKDIFWSSDAYIAKFIELVMDNLI